MGAIRESRRQRSSNTNPIIITDLRLTYLDWIYQLGILTTKQLATLCDKKYVTLKKGMRELFDHGYVHRPHIRDDYTYWMRTPEYHVLSNKGATALRGACGYVIKKDFDRCVRTYSLWKWAHDRAHAEFLVKLIDSTCRDPDITLLLTKDLSNQGIVQSKEPWRPRNWRPFVWNTKHGRVVPDDVLVFRNNTRPEGQNMALVLLEIDMGTEPIERTTRRCTDIRWKMQKYIEAYENGAHTRALGLRNMRIVFLTNSQERCDSMITLAIRLGIEKSMFLFSTHDDARRCDNLLNLCWTTNKGRAAYLTRKV